MEALPSLRRREIEVEKGKAECPDCGFVAYASSKPTASAVCVDDEGRVLLARRGDRAVQGHVGLPRRVPRRGGASARLPPPRAAARRRASRSSRSSSSASGSTTTAETGPPQTTLNLYWTARIVEGDARACRRRCRVPLVRARRDPRGGARVPAHRARCSQPAGRARVARAARSRTRAASRAPRARRRPPPAAGPPARRREPLPALLLPRPRKPAVGDVEVECPSSRRSRSPTEKRSSSYRLFATSTTRA